MIDQAAAFLAQIETAGGLTVYRGDKVPAEAERARHYAVVYTGVPTEGLDTYGAAATTHGYTASVLHVGCTENEVLFDMQRSRGALRRVRLSTTATPLKRIDGDTYPRRDEQTEGPRLYVATDVWRWTDSLA